MKLNPKQKKFCESYVQTGNATQSYKDAGYVIKNDESARASASQLLTNPNVRIYLDELRKPIVVKTQIGVEKIIDKLSQMAFGDLSDVVEVDDRGMVKLKKGADLSRLDGVSTNEAFSEGGHSKSTSIKLKDQLKALDMLCKILGIYERRETDNSRVLRDAAPRVLGALKRYRESQKLIESNDSPAGDVQ